MRLLNLKHLKQKRLFLSLLCLFLLGACTGTPTPGSAPTSTSAPSAAPTSSATEAASATASVTSAANAASSQDSAPAAAVTTYLNAMVKNDVSIMPQLVCPAYEAGAKTDFDSFGAIGGVKLDNVSCTTVSVSGDSATVTCTGSIDYTYNGEANSQDLSGNTYSAQQVDGEWTMCGYK